VPSISGAEVKGKAAKRKVVGRHTVVVLRKVADDRREGVHKEDVHREVLGAKPPRDD